MPTDIDTVETGKLIRKVLSESFPEIKFNTHLQLFDTKSCITVYWTDGPNRQQVREVIKLFGGFKHIEFDGMAVKFEPEFVFTIRHFSDSFVQSAIDTCCRSDTKKPTLKSYRDEKGEPWGIYSLRKNGDNIQADINAYLNKQSDVKPQKSETLSRMKWLY